jgi:hypothetical protein
MKAEIQGLWTAKKSDQVRSRGSSVVLFLLLFPGLLALSARKTDICHYTGNDKNPYQSISVPIGDVKSTHGNHSKDIIPAPNEGCPSTIADPLDPPPTAFPADKATPAPTPSPDTPTTPSKAAANTQTPASPKPPVETATSVSTDAPEHTSTPTTGKEPGNETNATKVATHPANNPTSTAGSPTINLTATVSPDPSTNPALLFTVTPQATATPNTPRTFLENIYTWCCTQRERLPLYVALPLGALAGIVLCLIIAMITRLRQNSYP